MSSRKGTHLYSLRHSNHRSKTMQIDYDKYGEDSLRFFVLEKVFTFDRNELFSVEQKWIDQYQPEYNANKLTGNHFHESAFSETAKKKSIDKRKGRKQPQEEKDKRTASLLVYYSNPQNHEKLKKTPEQKERLRWLATGDRNGNWGKKRSVEFKNMIGTLFSSVEYTFTSPSGNDIVFTNLSKTGIEITGLSYWQLRQLYRGRKNEYGGWKFKSSKNIGYKKER